MLELKMKSPRLLVIGDLIVDHYLWGSCKRISPEAPVQVIDIDNETTLLGGAGNVINNLKALGAHVDVISVVGKCDVSIEVKALLKNIKVDTKNIFLQSDRILSKKSRVISAQQQVIRFDKESTEEINIESQKQVLNAFTKIIKNYDIVLLSDYGKGVLSKELTQSIIAIANKKHKKVLVDPKGADYSKYKGAHLLTPNKKEASEATGISISNDNKLVEAITQLKVELDLDYSIITLSDKGVAIFDDEFRIHPTFTREVFDVTGAGDTVLASLGYALASDLSIDEAIEFSNYAAGVVVGKIGSATANLDEIMNYKSKVYEQSSDKHIKSFQEIGPLVKNFKLQNKKIVFSNGCFDLLHPGHISYLESAKKFGDILILGLNSDSSVSKLKGANRPINNQADRAQMLAALKVVDYVVIFNEDTPYELINIIRPHVLVKGGDYHGKEIIGQDLAEELKIVRFIDGQSSTKTIEKILKRTQI